MNYPAVYSPVSFYSKARSLQEIARLLTTARVLPWVVFTVSEWSSSSKTITQRILERADMSGPWIVRSSSLSEDGKHFSNAGRFLSVPDVRTEAELRNAIVRVVDSYGNDVQARDEILVQPMARDLIASGVATTLDAVTGLSYRIINLTHESRSDAVTSGDSACRACVYLAPQRPPADHPCYPVFDLLDELSALTGGLALDVEFGLDAQGVTLFQLRRLTGVNATDTSAAEARLIPHIQAAMKHASQLLGRSGHEATALGVMPDWNPAEMIGLKPRPLSFDLYAELITDRAWAQGRVPFGYCDMSSHRLMHLIAGTPYIDIAASVRSLLPASLPADSMQAIVNAAIAKLRTQPQLHDKMELTVLPTCLTPDMVIDGHRSPALALLEPARRRELIDGLRAVTRAVVRSDGPFHHALRVVHDRLPLIESLNLGKGDPPEVSHLVVTARSVLAPRFSLIARAAFVATAILRSLEHVGAVRPGFFDAFMRGIRTISHDISRDATQLRTEDFVRRYGHVRPATYDIRVPSYADAHARYFCERPTPCHGSLLDSIVPLELSAEERRSAEKATAELQLGLSLQELLHFARQAIVGRESTKFVYSGYVSHTLEAVVRAGHRTGLDRESLSYLDLPAALDLASAKAPDGGAVRAAIDRRRDAWTASASVRVPYLLFDAEELLGFDEFQSQPNYVTNREVVGRVVVLNRDTVATAADCAGAVVMMEAADPGQDWIFAAGIAGLVTAFGGENSHMAIRSREFDMPAVIGVGGRQFSVLSAARALRIDCTERRIEVIH